MALPEVCGLWIGSGLSKIEQLCIRSFQDHGHRFVLYTYDDIANVPSGTDVRDASGLVSRTDLQEFIRRGTMAGFSDWFRWTMLYKQGGYWVDMDMVCLAPFDFAADIVFGFQQDNIPAQGVLRFPMSHPAVAELVDRSMNPHRLRPEDGFRRRVKKTLKRLVGGSRAKISWAEGGGPIGFRHVATQHGLLKYGVPYTVFYPVHNTQFWSMFDETFAQDERFFAATRAIHLWNEVGRRYFNWDKNASFHPDSLIERLKRRHGVQ